jgi:AcrR family transcriptional regulator
MKRARKTEHKLERRQAILAAAWGLFQKTAYAEVTMAAVARRARLAKGTLFLYFKTKEALFLGLLVEQLQTWFDEADTALQAMPGVASAAEMAGWIGRSFKKRSGLTRLLAVLSTLLEQNVDLETALQFKRWLLEHLVRTGGLLEARLPFLQAGQGAQLLLSIQALVVGYWHLADPAPVMQKALKGPGMQVFKVDFSTSFESTLLALLAGLEAQSRTQPSAGRMS